MVEQPKRRENTPYVRADFVQLVGVACIALVILLGRRNLISEEFVVYACVGTVAFACGYMILKHID